MTATGTGSFKPVITPETSSAAFEILMSVVIVLNAISIGLSIDLHPRWVGWVYIDVGFAILFTLEISGKLRHGLRYFFYGPQWRWNIFEAILVTLAIVEASILVAHRVSAKPPDGRGLLGALRVFRLARVARILRLCRLSIFAELLMMINGAIGGIRTLIWSHLLLAVPLYLVAMLLRETLGNLADEGHGNGVENFSSLSASLFTSFRCLVSGDCTTEDGKPIFLLVSKAYGFGFALLYCFASVFMTFGLFNVIVAIYVENAVAAAKFNDLRQKQIRLTDQRMFAQKALELVELIWQRHEDNDRGCSISELSPLEAAQVQITPDLFDELRRCKEFKEILKYLDIADEAQVDLFETLDVDGGGTLDLEELVQGIAKLRGDARRSDVVSVSLMVRAMLENLTDFTVMSQQQLFVQSQVLGELHQLLTKRDRHPLPASGTREVIGSSPAGQDTGKDMRFPVGQTPHSRCDSADLQQAGARQNPLNRRSADAAAEGSGGRGTAGRGAESPTGGAPEQPAQEAFGALSTMCGRTSTQNSTSTLPYIDAEEGRAGSPVNVLESVSLTSPLCATSSLASFENAMIRHSHGL